MIWNANIPTIEIVAIIPIQGIDIPMISNITPGIKNKMLSKNKMPNTVLCKILCK